VESLLRLNRLRPQSPLADATLFFAARATRKSSDYKGATQLFEKLIKKYPDSTFIEQAEIESAECMIEAGRAGEAARRFEQFIQNNLDSPLRPLALYDMGRALQRAGKFEEAIDQYKAAAGDKTTELAARCRFAMAQCLAELDRGEEATAELIRMTQGGFPIGWAARARLQVARLLERDNRMDEARHIYSTVAVEYADDAAGLVALKAVERIESDTLISAER
jgi:TolA-binding protein